jgi:multicomponent Na+:H+ antiporter subunit D
MWMIEIPIFVPFFIGALIAAFTRGTLRSVLMVAVPIFSALHLWMIPEGIHLQFAFLDYQLIPYRVDKLSILFGYVFHIAALIGIIYSLHLRDTIQQVSAMLYAGSSMGAVFAGDLLTLFVFWELLAFTSVFFILARRTQRSYTAAMHYLIIQVLSGVILLIGTIFYAIENNTLAFGYIGLNSIAGWLIFIAFGIKCAFPFAHNWLTESYPEATVTGTVFLSAFTTKVAVYALARSYPGTELLIYIGAAMTCFPIFFAVIENDLRRVLAYSLINQVGFMVVGIGIGTALAINGAVAHAFNDVIFKGLLFMSMGAVLHMTGKINGSELGGLYKTMPKTTILCIAIGIYPQALYTLLPYDTGYNPYDATHVLAQTQLLFFSALAFVWLNLKKMYPPELRSTNLDFDWVYRRALPHSLKNIFAIIWQIDRTLRQEIKQKLTLCLIYMGGKNNRLSGLLSRNYPSGSMAMWVVVVLATYLLLSFIR